MGVGSGYQSQHGSQSKLELRWKVARLVTCLPSRLEDLSLRSESKGEKPGKANGIDEM